MDRSLDVSDLEPPEPLELILAALSDMPSGDRLRVVHRREPFPLYDLLRRAGFDWRTEDKEGRFEILIWRPVDGANRPVPDFDA